MLPSTLRPPSRRKMRRRRGTGTSSASHSVYAYLSFGPLPALALGTFLLCYALVLSCLLPMLAVMRDEPPVRGVRFSGLQGAHAPRREDLAKAGHALTAGLGKIGGKVKRRLRPESAYGELMDEAVSEFEAARGRKRIQRARQWKDAEEKVGRRIQGGGEDEDDPENFGVANEGGEREDRDEGKKDSVRSGSGRSGIEKIMAERGERAMDTAIEEIAGLEAERVVNSDADAPIKSQQPGQRSGVVVLGMHRSGTSMLSGLLVSGMGFKVGKPLIGAAFDNEKGFFELLPVVLQNDEWMNKQKVWWSANVINYDPEKALRHKEQGEVTFDEGEHALAFLNNPDNTPWLQKDPRMCITLRTWLPLLKSQPAVIFTYRHPLEVALSLKKREEDFDLEHGLRLWIVYNMRAVQNSADLCRVLSSNEAVLADPLGEIRRIANELTTLCHVAAPPSKLTQTVVDDFIDPNLQHNKKKREKDQAQRKVLAQHGEDCKVLDYDSEFETLTPRHKREMNMYLMAMKVYCDFKSGEAYKENYEWPTLP